MCGFVVEARQTLDTATIRLTSAYLCSHCCHCLSTIVLLVYTLLVHGSIYDLFLRNVVEHQIPYSRLSRYEHHRVIQVRPVIPSSPSRLSHDACHWTLSFSCSTAHTILYQLISSAAFT